MSFRKFECRGPLPGFCGAGGPAGPGERVSSGLLLRLGGLTGGCGFAKVDCSGLSSRFGRSFGVSVSGMVVFGFLVSRSLLEVSSSHRGYGLVSGRFRSCKIRICRFTSFLERGKFRTSLLRPLSSGLDLETVTVRSESYVVAEDGVYLFGRNLRGKFFVVCASVSGLPIGDRGRVL